MKVFRYSLEVLAKINNRGSNLLIVEDGMQPIMQLRVDGLVNLDVAYTNNDLRHTAYPEVIAIVRKRTCYRLFLVVMQS